MLIILVLGHRNELHFKVLSLLRMRVFNMKTCPHWTLEDNRACTILLNALNFEGWLKI